MDANWTKGPRPAKLPSIGSQSKVAPIVVTQFVVDLPPQMRKALGGRITK